jgi:ABC-2 type transport system permease protein
MNSIPAVKMIPSFSLNKIFKYLSVAKISFANSFAYMANVISRSWPVFIRVWIFVQLYEVTFSVTGTSQVNGLTVAATIWILAFAQSFGNSSRPPISRIINDEIRSGDLQYVISRPYSYIGFHYFSQMGRIAAFLVPSIAVSVGSAWFFVGGIDVSIEGLAWGSVLFLLGMTLDFLMSFAIGSLAFWIEDSTSLTWIYHKAQIILGGLIIPIAMFPEGVRRVVEILPFSQLFYSAASIIVNFDMQTVERFLMIQGFWIGIFLTIVIMMFRRGIRNVSINGG